MRKQWLNRVAIVSKRLKVTTVGVSNRTVVGRITKYRFFLV